MSGFGVTTKGLPPCGEWIEWSTEEGIVAERLCRRSSTEVRTIFWARRNALNVEYLATCGQHPEDPPDMPPAVRVSQLTQAEREWRVLKRRYEHLTEFFDIVRRDVAARDHCKR